MKMRRGLWTTWILLLGALLEVGVGGCGTLWDSGVGGATGTCLSPQLQTEKCLELGGKGMAPDVVNWDDFYNIFGVRARS